MAFLEHQKLAPGSELALVLALVEVFGNKIPVEHPDNLTTVGDVIQYIEAAQE